MSSEKIQKRVERVLKEKAREVFEAGKFNIEMFQHVIDEYFKQKKEAEEKEEAAKKEAQEEEQLESPGIFSRFFGEHASAKGKATAWASIAVCVVIFGLMMYQFFPFGPLF